MWFRCGARNVIKAATQVHSGPTSAVVGFDAGEIQRRLPAFLWAADTKSISHDPALRVARHIIMEKYDECCLETEYQS